MFFFLAVPASAAVVIPEVDLTLKPAASMKREAGVQTTTITRKKIETSPTVTFADLLKQEQSIARVINNTNDNSQLVLSIRGFGDNAFANSLIVVDGFPLINPSVLAPSLNAISLADILRVDILQASEGSLWGAQAVGGVVKVETRRPEKRIASANVAYGRYHNQVYNLLLGDKFENGVFFKLLGFSQMTDNYRDHNQQRNQSLSSQLGFDYASGSLTLNAKVYEDDIQLPGGLTQQQYENNPRQASNHKNFSHFQTNVYQLLHQQALGDRWSLETRLSHNDVQGNGLIGSRYTREDTLNTFNPLLIGTLWQSKVLLGYQGQASRFQLASATARQQADTTQHDVYAQVIVPLWSRVDMTLGGRSAWQESTLGRSLRSPSSETDHQVFVSEQGLVYRPSKPWEFFLRRDGNFRFPKANEQTALPVQVSALLPQTGVSYEMGAKRQGLRQTTQLSLYRLQLNNEIAYDSTQTALVPFGSYSNFPETLRHGVTLTERYSLTEKLILDGQVNYVDARFASGVEEGHRIPAVPAINGNLGLSYRFRPHWQAKYTALYTGSRYPSQDVSNVGQQLSGYWLSGVSLQYLRKVVNVSFDVENVFNQRYPIYAIYSTATQAVTYYPGVGRSFLVTVKFNF